MSLRDLFRPKSDATKIAGRAEIISRYKHLRAIGRNLNHKLVKRLSKVDLHKGAEKLGILQRGIMVFNSEDESSVLMDYCLYDVRRNGRNAVERYLIDSPPDLDSDEMVCLRAMQHAIYSLFVVESVERGLGVTVRDMFSDETILIVDIRIGSSAQPGLVFASRLLFHDGFSMTGGAALPVAVLPKDEHQALTEKLAEAVTPDEDGDFDPAPLIRACLSKGCSSQVRYEDPTRGGIGQQPALSSHGSAKVGRNTLCPCGSGKKFKHCCMKSR